MKPHADITDPRVVKALAHPLRVRILAALEERTASPSELSEELDAPLGNVSYHVRQLASLGLVKLVRRTPRRGAIEHHYRAEARPQITDQAWSQVPEIVKQAMIGASLVQVSAQVNAAAAAGGFSRPDAHLTRTDLMLDERGWKQLSEEMVAMLRRADELQTESLERLEGADHQGARRATLVMMLFEGDEVAPEHAGAVSAKRADGELVRQH